MNLLADSVSPLQMNIPSYKETYLEQAEIHLAFWLSQSYLACKEQKHN